MRVLVIEDEHYNAELLTARLGLLGCESAIASGLDEGVALAVSWRPDLVLLDLRFKDSGPAMQGAEILTALRGAPETAAIPIVLHSIYVSYPGDLPPGLPPVDGFLKKPFSLDDLRQVVETFRPGTNPR
jgi:CheY-like chemotaxis protein